jgi:Archaea bacterial proteins of unknown function
VIHFLIDFQKAEEWTSSTGRWWERNEEIDPVALSLEPDGILFPYIAIRMVLRRRKA